MLSSFSVPPPKTPSPLLLALPLCMRVLLYPLVQTLLPQCPSIAHPWIIMPVQDQGHSLPLMPDKAFLYYVSSWKSGYPLMYYVLGGLVHVSFVRLCLVDFVDLLMGLQAPSVTSVLVLTSPLGSPCSVLSAQTIWLCEAAYVLVRLWKSLSGDSLWMAFLLLCAPLSVPAFSFDRRNSGLIFLR